MPFQTALGNVRRADFFAILGPGVHVVVALGLVLWAISELKTEPPPQPPAAGWRLASTNMGFAASNLLLVAQDWQTADTNSLAGVIALRMAANFRSAGSNLQSAGMAIQTALTGGTSRTEQSWDKITAAAATGFRSLAEWLKQIGGNWPLVAGGLFFAYLVGSILKTVKVDWAEAQCRSLFVWSKSSSLGASDGTFEHGGDPDFPYPKDHEPHFRVVAGILQSKLQRLNKDLERVKEEKAKLEENPKRVDEESEKAKLEEAITRVNKEKVELEKNIQREVEEGAKLEMVIKQMEEKLVFPLRGKDENAGSEAKSGREFRPGLTLFNCWKAALCHKSPSSFAYAQELEGQVRLYAGMFLAGYLAVLIAYHGFLLMLCLREGFFGQLAPFWIVPGLAVVFFGFHYFRCIPESWVRYGRTASGIFWIVSFVCLFGSRLATFSSALPLLLFSTVSTIIAFMFGKHLRRVRAGEVIRVLSAYLALREKDKTGQE